MGWFSKLVFGDDDDTERVIAEAERITREAAPKRKPKDDKKKREEGK